MSGVLGFNTSECTASSKRDETLTRTEPLTEVHELERHRRRRAGRLCVVLSDTGAQHEAAEPCRTEREFRLRLRAVHLRGQQPGCLLSQGRTGAAAAAAAAAAAPLLLGLWCQGYGRQSSLASCAAAEGQVRRQVPPLLLVS